MPHKISPELEQVDRNAYYDSMRATDDFWEGSYINHCDDDIDDDDTNRLPS